MALYQDLSERIHQPIVQDVLDEYSQRGLTESTEKFLQLLTPDVANPLYYTLVTHVYREKGLFLDLIGEEIGIPDESRHVLAMSADVLWALSLMMDDIQDGDITRGGRPSSWAEYGKEATVHSAYNSLEQLIKLIYHTTRNPQISALCASYVQLGVRSLSEHKSMDLTTSTGEILANYENRCDFHATFQLLAMFHILLEGQLPEHMFSTVEAFRLINQSGQLINDLKDFLNGDLYGRGYSDIRNAVPTVPLVYMHANLSARDSKDLSALFGKSRLTPHEIFLLDELAKRSGVVTHTKSRISDNYTRATVLLNSLYSSQLCRWFKDWTAYKMGLIE